MFNESHKLTTQAGEEILPGTIIRNWRQEPWKYQGITMLPADEMTYGRIDVRPLATCPTCDASVNAPKVMNFPVTAFGLKIVKR